jgi:glycosyltransferase involved in cell wall biosynthesis
MTKILFINSFYFPYVGGGAEIIFREQVEAFKNRGHDVVVLTTKSGRGLTIDDVNNIKVYRTGLTNIYWHFSTRKPNKYMRMFWHHKDVYNKSMRASIRKIIDIERPDAVICHNLSGFSIAAWDEIKAAGLPIIQVLHDLYLMCPNSNMFKDRHACSKQCWVCKLMRTHHVKKSGNVDMVVGVSAYILNKFKGEDYFKDVPSRVIHNARAIPEPSQYPDWDGEAPLRLGYIGTLSKPKGVEWLIAQFMGTTVNATLSVAGRGSSIEYERYLQCLAAPDKRITFCGYVKPDDFYPQIHVLIAPSIWDEPFGLVAIEACARHIPVITSATGGLKEIITDGYNGLYCEVSTPDSLSDAINKIAGDRNLLDALRANTRESVRPFLDIDRLTDEYEEVYKRIIADKTL